MRLLVGIDADGLETGSGDLQPCRAILLVYAPVGLIAGDGDLSDQSAGQELGGESLAGAARQAVGRGNESILALSGGTEENEVGVGERHYGILLVIATARAVTTTAPLAAHHRRGRIPGGLRRPSQVVSMTALHGGKVQCFVGRERPRIRRAIANQVSLRRRTGFWAESFRNAEKASEQAEKTALKGPVERVVRGPGDGRADTPSRASL